MPVQTLNTMPSDADLLAGIARGDEASLAALHDRYHRLAFSLALRVVNDRGRAEDVVQDAFLAVWRKAATYTQSRGSAKTWLTSIVRNRAIDIVRARRESDADDEATLLTLRDGAPDVVEQVAASLDRQVVRSAIGELPADQRRALAMAYFEGLSHSEIADATGIPLGTVKSRIRLGMTRLRGAVVARGIHAPSASWSAASAISLGSGGAAAAAQH